MKNQTPGYLKQGNHRKATLYMSSPVSEYGVTFFKPVERETGFEPATACLEGRNSTTELLPLATY